MAEKTAAKQSGRQQEWEQKWSRADYVPMWDADEPPRELLAAMSTESFPREGALLDIGCGTGRISARLAERGYSVTGIDFAPSAIDKAEQTHKGVANLKFQVVDACGEPTDLGRFQVLFDRGCLHTIPRELARNYADNVARWAAPEAHYFLLFKTPPGKDVKVKQRREQAKRFLGQLFREAFELKGVRPTRILGQSREGKQMAMPALAVWMISK